MEKYLVADTYVNWEQVGESFTENGKEYVNVKQSCPRCGGAGIFFVRVHNGHGVPAQPDRGVCYQCGGTGVEHKKVRVYSEKELNRMNRAKEQRREKAEKERHERQLQRQQEWPARHGFDEDGTTWIFVKGDTYAIKDSLKEIGYKFDKQLGWHGAECLEDLPDGYEIYQIGFGEVYEWPHEMASEPEFIGEKIIADAKAKAGQGEFVGEVGERLRALDVQLMSVREYDGAYGLSYIYQFSYKGDILVWMTTKWMDIEPDEWYILTGTVKQHKNYRGMNQTYLSRCIVKEKQNE